MYSRCVFGIAAIEFGIVSLVWRDSEMWRLGMLPGWILIVALIAGGVSLLMPRTARFGAIVAGAVFGVYVIACACSIVAAPLAPGGYIDGFEQLAIVCGALALYAAHVGDADRGAMLVRVARVMLGICCVSFAWAQVLFLQYTASLVPAWMPVPVVLTDITTAAFALAAIALLVDRQAVLAMRLLGIMIALFGVLVWVPVIAAHPAALTNWSEIGENYLIAAAAWLVAGSYRHFRA